MSPFHRPARESLRAAARRWATGLAQRLPDDRGDVPGWVLIAVMTAGLVTAIWLVADDQLTSVLSRAIGSVTQP
jgi:hypothetical protein